MMDDFNESEMWHLREAMGDYLAGFVSVDTSYYASADYADAISAAEKIGLNVDNFPAPTHA